MAVEPVQLFAHLLGPGWLCIDPGKERSAYVVIDSVGGLIRANGFEWNQGGGLLRDLRCGDLRSIRGVVIETMASRGGGARAGADQHTTNLWAGRFWEAAAARGLRVELYDRDTVKRAITHRGTARDSNVSSALKAIWGGPDEAVGTKRRPGPLYGIKGDEWQALALGVYALEQEQRKA